MPGGLQTSAIFSQDFFLHNLFFPQGKAILA
jgi:hypothetical protein